MATRLWGGRLLSKIARSHTSFLVGQEWRAFGKQRLYCTLIDPSAQPTATSATSNTNSPTAKTQRLRLQARYDK